MYRIMPFCPVGVGNSSKDVPVATFLVFNHFSVSAISFKSTISSRTDK